MKRSRIALIAGAATMLFSGEAAHANAGVPMIFITYPVMLLALLPIIGIETAVLERVLRRGFKQTAWRVGVANAASMLCGFPLTWLVWFWGIEAPLGYGMARMNVKLPGIWQRVFESVVFAPWLAPYEQYLYWMVPTAALAGLIPAFFMSVSIERWLLARMLRPVDIPVLRRLVWRANLVTYALMASSTLIWLASNLVKAATHAH